jgi:peptidoglycan/LPS O-acetylase OafA/YrhL
VAFHAGLPVPGGFVGVDVFFVISGFVITLMLRREWVSHGTIQLGRFYRRRFQRLAPALAVMVAATVVVSALVLSPFGFQQRAALTAMGAELWVANFVIAFTTGGYFDFIAHVNPLLHTWSLSVEEQFYLLFPGLILITWLVGRRLGARWLAAVVLAVVCVASFAVALLGLTGWTPPLGASLLGFYSPVTRAWEFGVGALVALGWRHLARVPVSLPCGLAWIGIVGVAASLWLITPQTPFPGPWTLLPVVSTALVLTGASAEGSRVRAFLSRAPAVKVGDWSYSYYLWHWPFIVFAGLIWPGAGWVIIAAALASLAPAVLSYHYVEQPIRVRHRPSRRWVAGLVAATLLPPLVLAGSLLMGANRGWGMEEVQAEQAAGYPRGDGMPVECMTRETIAGNQPTAFGDCTVNAESSGVPIYLVGDSNAAMYWTVLNEVAMSLDRPLIVSTAADCPFLDVYRVSQWGPAADRACRDYVEGGMAWLAEQRPGTVVLAGTIRYAGDSTYGLGPTQGEAATDSTGRIRALSTGLASTVRALRDEGHEVVTVLPTYRVDYWTTPITMDRCSTWSLLRATCPTDIPTSRMPSWQNAYRDEVRRVAAESGATAVDMQPWQCPEGVCSSRSGDTRVYDDPGHLTSDVTRLALPEFTEAVSEALPANAGR